MGHNMLMPEKLNVRWARCGEDRHWCNLLTLDLDSVKDKEGVYIIWNSKEDRNVVYVGQGNLYDRLEAHKTNDEIINFSIKNYLFVTWAIMPEKRYRDGVERYLIENYKPFLNQKLPKTDPIKVNHPSNRHGT